MQDPSQQATTVHNTTHGWAGRRRALLLSRGDWSVFVTRPLSASLLAAGALLLVIVLLPSIKNKREEAFVED